MNINTLKNPQPLIIKFHMHNLYAIFAKYLDICKQIADNLVNARGNLPRCDVVPKFSDLEVVALSTAFESIGIDSESLLKPIGRIKKINNLLLKKRYRI